MIKRILLPVFLFAIIGEVMIRVDKGFHLFEDTRVVKIATDVKITPEYQMISQRQMTFDEHDLRIMVLGDSYIAGGGINADERFSQQLKALLTERNKQYKHVYVLDVSRPSSNTLDNYQSYFHFVDSFKPQMVILGYNINDVNGNLQKAVDPESVARNITVTNSRVKLSAAQKISQVYKQSKLLDFTMHKLHTEMKAIGVIFPHSEFDMQLRSYYENKPNWQASKLLLREVAEDAAKRSTKLLVLKFPEINLLEYPQLFTRADDSISHFFKTLPAVTYIDGTAIFKGEHAATYMLSKYDGHPNEKAHKKIAVAIAQYIEPGK